MASILSRRGILIILQILQTLILTSFESIDLVERLFKEGKNNCRLLVIDSIAALSRYVVGVDHGYTERHHVLTQQATQLK